MTLHPSIRDKAREFLNKAEAQGIKLRITDGYRSPEKQDELYAQGRTKAGSIVTNAKKFESLHNYGLAADVVPLVNGSADWNSKEWSKIGDIGKSIGFAQGGDWTGFVDRPHFEMTFGKSIAQLKSRVDSGNMVGDYVNLS